LTRREGNTAWGEGKDPGSVEGHFAVGLELMRAGAYFEAHEELELAWRAAAAEERDFFQGLVHVTVAWYQAGRGRELACRRQLEKAQARLTACPPQHRGVEVSQLLEQLTAALDQIEAGDLDLASPLV
jgi:predicted metal-dependent hydrolase